jgi:hypothetical protein
MTSDATCPACGAELDLPELSGSGKRAVTCSQCGARLQLTLSIDGGETLFQPQLLAQGVTSPPPPAGSEPGGVTRPVGSSTTHLEAGELPLEEKVPTVEHACLLVSGAPPGSERLRLDRRRTVVGREGADLEVPDAAISSRHFEVERRGSDYFVRDLGSSNGTFVNGHRIRAVQLRPGDAIRAGRTTFTFRIFEAIAL